MFPLSTRFREYADNKIVCHAGGNVKAAFALTLAREPPLGQLGRCKVGHDDDDYSQQIERGQRLESQRAGHRRVGDGQLEMLDKGDIIRVCVAAGQIVWRVR